MSTFIFENIFLSFNGSNFINITISEEIKNQTIEIRKNKNLKLPDSIIVASAIVQNAILVTSDKKLLNLDFLDVIELKEIQNWS